MLALLWKSYPENIGVWPRKGEGEHELHVHLLLDPRLSLP